MKSDSWLGRATGPRRKFRLFCFAYAGGSSSIFSRWQDMVSPEIEICAIRLPGRGARFNEKPIRSFPQLIEVLAYVIKDNSDLPFAFFGHSLGGLIAFELARHCLRNSIPPPTMLFLSASSAPQLLDLKEKFSDLADDELIEKLKAYNGTPIEILQNRELIGLFLPPIRDDFSLLESFQYKPFDNFDIPITVLAGKLDKEVSPEKIFGWAEETAAACNFNWFEGDHFFINTESEKVLETLNLDLTRLLKTCY
ncbi:MULTISPECIES: thioesterase II family protein [unclassified Janthinobacterium]|uniref:thioesterase II family protein n=1 Tax=unclassified Janthinobacterium TaxID=2610881 RepID=UPI0012F995DE|nr:MULTISPECIES: thioesterase domain-containing protein [unclassified Janthinobacterium]MEC5160920.1 surfactin synthase thioesterase subunit [Janthinobacterium sp. CG_S6]